MQNDRNDVISRQAVLKLLHALPSEEATTKAMLIQSVKQMDAAQPEQRWIPCAPETMPENDDEVFVTYTVNGKKQRYVETAMWYDGDEGYWTSPWDEYRVPGTKVEIIAWMPLPEPYKGEEYE